MAVAGADVPFLDLAAANAEVAEALESAWARVRASGWYVLGAEVEAFEAEFAAYCGVGRAIGVANGLDALVLILEALGVGPGDEVVVPAHTFIATWQAVSMVGATPVAAEPAPGRLNVSLEESRWRCPPSSPSPPNTAFPSSKTPPRPMEPLLRPPGAGASASPPAFPSIRARTSAPWGTAAR
jgi:hypothetical protein